MSVKSNPKRELILSTGKDLFWKFGFRRVTIEEICKEAGISKMTLLQVLFQQNGPGENTYGWDPDEVPWKNIKTSPTATYLILRKWSV